MALMAANYVSATSRSEMREASMMMKKLRFHQQHNHRNFDFSTSIDPEKTRFYVLPKAQVPPSGPSKGGNNIPIHSKRQQQEYHNFDFPAFIDQGKTRFYAFPWVPIPPSGPS